MSPGYLGHLECPRCRELVDEAESPYGCPVCARDGVPVNVHPAYELSSELWQPDPSAPGIFRHRRLLPLPLEAPLVSLAEGGTPLLHLRNTGSRIGLQRLYLKDESRNPTWSYKDRLAAVAVSKACHDGADTVVVATTGNHGAAAAAYAAAAGLRCVTLTLPSVPPTMQVLMQAYGAVVVALEKGPERWELMRAAVSEWGWTPVSGLKDPPIGSNPFGIDGYKTIAYEAFEEMGEVPDVVVVPTAYADGLVGILRGFADLVALGLTAQLPRMVAAEPLGPFAASLARDDDTPATVESRPSVAFSIAGSVATYQGVAALRASRGHAVVVPEDSVILDAQLSMAREEGLYLEASAAISVPAVELLLRRGEVDPGESVLLIGTSSGLKDIGATALMLPEVPVVEPTLAALQRVLVSHI